MKKFTLFLFVMFATITLSSFSTNKAVIPPGTGVGYQLDADYYYTFFADLTTSSPYPLTYIEVQRLSTGEVLTGNSFSGTVLHSRFLMYTINGTATVSFYDNGVLVTKSLTGFIEGGILP
jgi:hypothetical protein